MVERFLNNISESSLLNGRHTIFRAANVEDANLVLTQAKEYILKSSNNVTFLEISPEGGSIGIDEIRIISGALAMKSTGDEKLVVLIYSATTLTQEAQNALLKNLEDSNEGKQFVLAADFSNKLLLTILSRADIHDYRPPTNLQLSKAEQAVFKASGYSMTKLNTYREDNGDLNLAKTWLGSNHEERIVINKQFTSQASAKAFIDSILIALSAVLHMSYKDNDNIHRMESVSEKMSIALKVSQRISNKGNLKLNLSQLALLI